MQIPATSPGVPSPYVATVHPYPTRYHGGIWVRPVFGFPRVANVHNVLIPGRDLSGSPDGLGCASCAGLGQAVDTGSGVFRHPSDGGGGIFNRSLDGDLSTPSVVGFVLAALAAGGVTYWYLTRKR